MLALVVRMLVSLAVVLALMYLAARLLNRSRRGFRPMARPRLAGSRLAAAAAGNAAHSSADLEIVKQRPLGKGASVAVVRAADRTWLVGVTETSVRLLSELGARPHAMSDDAGPAAVPGLSASPAPVTLLEQLRERTVRRA